MSHAGVINTINSGTTNMLNLYFLHRTVLKVILRFNYDIDKAFNNLSFVAKRGICFLAL